MTSMIRSTEIANVCKVARKLPKKHEFPAEVLQLTKHESVFSTFKLYKLILDYVTKLPRTPGEQAKPMNRELEPISIVPYTSSDLLSWHIF